MAASSVTRGTEKKTGLMELISSGGNQVISKIFYIKHVRYLIMTAIWNAPRIPTSSSLFDVHCYRCTPSCRLWQSIYLLSCLILLVPKFWTCKKLLSKLLQTGATLHFCVWPCMFLLSLRTLPPTFPCSEIDILPSYIFSSTLQHALYIVFIAAGVFVAGWIGK